MISSLTASPTVPAVPQLAEAPATTAARVITPTSAPTQDGLIGAALLAAGGSLVGLLYGPKIPGKDGSALTSMFVSAVVGAGVGAGIGMLLPF